MNSKHHRGLSLGLGLLFAGNLAINAQKVTFSKEQVSLKQAFEKIETVSKYKIAYNESQLDINKKVTLNQKDTEVLDILSDLLQGTGCTYKVEKNIVEEFARGSHTAFRQLFKIYYPRIHTFIFGFIKDPDEAEDLAQNVFIRLWDKREIFLQVHHFDSYLFKLAKHTIFNYIAAKNLFPTTNDNLLDFQENDTPYETLIAKDLQLLIDMVVDNMPPQRKLIYQLSRINGLSNEQIATKLHLQKKTVENHLNLALRELKNTIASALIIYFMLMH